MHSSTAEQKIKFEALYEELRALGKSFDEKKSIVASRFDAEETRQYYRWALRERLIDKAHPDKVLSLIKRTNFHDPNSTLDLINYFIDVQGVLNAIPLGCSKDVTYKLYLDSPPTKLCVEYANSREEEERRSPDDPTTLAPPRYFCVVWHKFVVNEGKATILPTLDLKRRRKVSGESSHSGQSSDSGYRSASAEINPSPSRKSQVLTSSHPGHDEDLIGSLNDDHHNAQDEAVRTDATSYFSCVVHHPFYFLGNLFIVSQSLKQVPELGEYYVAVSLFDHSLWLIYDAWDDLWQENDYDDEDDILDDEEAVRPGPFRPAWGSSWARLPYTDGRVVIAKIGCDVRTYGFSATEDIQIEQMQGWCEEDAVPGFICAETGDGGRVVKPWELGDSCAA